MLRNYLTLDSSNEVLMFLETQKPHQGKSLLATHPNLILTVEDHTVKLKHEDGSIRQWQENAWDAFKRVRREYPGWWFCALSYDLKNQDEALQSSNPDPIGLPELIAFQPTQLLIEHEDGIITPLQLPNSSTPQSFTTLKTPFSIHPLSSATSSEAYCASIEAIKRDIFEGEYYELNLSHQLQTTFSGDGLSLYDAMAHKGPVPMAAFFKFDGIEVVSSSPERYLRLLGNKVISEPIKGTRPRSEDPNMDEHIRKELESSQKERAENLMIVDLVRNDLARIAQPGSVYVDRLFEIRSYATVHQMVSTVSAQVEHDTDPIDILRNTFPMGSMTGAPKKRVMQAIESYENYKRGLYSGAMGYINPDGDFDFNVVIRTAILNKGNLYYSVGGAITSDSDPMAEWDETWVKSRALPT
jgi:para-aminobenzoate synthetase component 1